MGIIGLTRDKDGAPIIRQAVTHKLVIGRGPSTAGNATNYPKKLDYIAFMKKNGDGKWVDDEELTSHYKEIAAGGKVTEVKIVLFDNDIDTVFPSAMKAFTARGCWCFGDGERAQRRGTLEELREKKWPEFAPYKGPCANGGCEMPEQKKCKAMGTLYFSLVDFLKLGSLCKVQTTSYQSVLQIDSALQTMRRLTGGVISGIPIKLFMQPDRAKYMEKGELKTSSKFVWGLEVSATDMREMSRQLTEGPRQMYEIRQLAVGTIIEAEEENSEDLGEEITGEFYAEEVSAGTPAGNTADGGPGEKRQGTQTAPPSAFTGSSDNSRAPQQEALDESALEEKADALMTLMGMGNRAYRTAELGKHRGKMREFVAALEERRAKSQKGQPDPGPNVAKDEPPQQAEKKSARQTVIDRQREKSAARKNQQAAPEQQEEDPFITGDDANEAQQKPAPGKQDGWDW